LAEIGELGLVHLTEPILELEDLVRRLTDLGLAREDGGELAPSLGRREESIERLDGVLVLGVRFHHSPVAADGRVDVLEL